MVTIQQGLREDGFEVSMVKLCRWFGVARRSVMRPVCASGSGLISRYNSNALMI